MSTKLTIEKIINHRYNRSSKTLSSAYKFLSYIKAGSKLKEGNNTKLSKDKNITGKKSIISNILFPELNRTNCRPKNKKKKIVNNYFKKIMEDNQIDGYTIQAEAGTGGFCRVLGVSKKKIIELLY